MCPNKSLCFTSCETNPTLDLSNIKNTVILLYQTLRDQLIHWSEVWGCVWCPTRPELHGPLLSLPHLQVGWRFLCWALLYLCLLLHLLLLFLQLLLLLLDLLLQFRLLLLQLLLFLFLLLGFALLLLITWRGWRRWGGRGGWGRWGRRRRVPSALLLCFLIWGRNREYNPMMRLIFLWMLAFHFPTFAPVQRLLSAPTPAVGGGRRRWWRGGRGGRGSSPFLLLVFFLSASSVGWSAAVHGSQNCLQTVLNDKHGSVHVKFLPSPSRIEEPSSYFILIIIIINAKCTCILFTWSK